MTVLLESINILYPLIICVDMLTVDHVMLIFTRSYWMDNGACYYYTTANFSNYEEVIIAVKKQADKDGIPYRYVQVTILYHMPIALVEVLLSLYYYRLGPQMINTEG